MPKEDSKRRIYKKTKSRNDKEAVHQKDPKDVVSRRPTEENGLKMK